MSPLGEYFTTSFLYSPLNDNLSILVELFTSNEYSKSKYRQRNKMGFINNLLSAQKTDLLADWKALDNVAQLEDLVAASFSQPIVIFKHSIRCGTSAMIKSQLEQNWAFDAEELTFYYLDLINFREVSNEVASRFGVVHQSPQIIVLKDGKAVFDTSHLMINTDAIKEAIQG